MKYYIIAGEASGDLHGSNLVKELIRQDASAKIRCWGGDLMKQSGAELVKHYRDHAFMGFIEVIINLRTILKNLEFCKQDIQNFHPDILILIDYPGFNIRIAKWAKRHQFRIVYYISPQVWAWKENRVKTMKQCIDKMLVILPFEKEYYKTKWDWEVEYVGHPLVEVVESYKLRVTSKQQPATENIIALLPGSRKQEIAKKLPLMLEASKYFSDYEFVIAQAPSLNEAFYKNFTAGYPNVSSVANQTYGLLMKATAALVTSGTATLETALFGVPQVVCYKASAISYSIAKRLIKVKYIALVNLIMNKQVVTELIQDELNIENLKKELTTILHNESVKAEIKNNYTRLKELLSQDSSASAKAAASIISLTSKSI